MLGCCRRYILSVLCVTLLCLESQAVAHDAQPHLVFAVHPYLPASELAQRFTPLIAYLENALEQPIALRIGATYSDHLEAIVRDEVDLAFIGPNTFISLQDKAADWPTAACLSFAGETRFRGAIVVREDSTITALSELAGRNFAFGDPLSTLGSIVPAAMLAKAGVALDDLAEHRHLNNHHSVAVGVLMGYHDAGGVKGEIYDEFADEGLRVVAYTPWIGSHLFVFGRNVPEPVREVIQQALFDLSTRPEGPAILDGIKRGTTALVPVDADNYNTLQGLRRVLGPGVAP